MLVQLLTANFGTPASAYVTAQVLTNVGATQDLTSVTPLATWFTLAKLTAASGGTTVLTITDVAVEGTATEGKIKITFDATVTDPDVVLGDILTIYGGSVIGSLGAVIGTTTIDTGLGTVTTSGQDLFITAPTLYKTANTLYDLTITQATQTGTPILVNLTNTDQPITINGVQVKSVKITPGNGTSFNNGTVIQFNIKYYDDINGTGNILEFDGNSTDTITASLIPQ